jgi:cell division protein FtsN
MSGDKGGSKADTLVKVVLFFFISLLSFSVGTFVGKQVSDSDHRQAALEGEYNGGRNVASVEEHGAAAAGHGEEKVSEKDVEALTEEFVNKEKSREPSDEGTSEKEKENAEHKEAATADGYKSYPRGKAEEKVAAVEHGTAEHGAKAATTAEHGAKAVKAVEHAAKAPAKAEHATADATHKTAEKVAEGKAPTDGAKEEKKAAPTLPSVAGSAVGKYTVQVGSYLDEKEAKTRSADLKAKGWQSFYLSANVKGKTYYRVLVGLFSNQDSAKEFKDKFMKEANTQNALVQKIVQ